MRLCLAITSSLLYPPFMNTAHHQQRPDAHSSLRLYSSLQLTAPGRLSRAGGRAARCVGPPPRSSRSRSSHRRLARSRPGSARRSGRHLVRGRGRVGVGVGVRVRVRIRVRSRRSGKRARDSDSRRSLQGSRIAARRPWAPPAASGASVP